MAKYRGKRSYRQAHPKIYVCSHTEKAEIEYFQAYKHHLKSALLMPKRIICGSPKELISKAIRWKKANIDEGDNDQVWCVFDVDDFFDHDSVGLVKAINSAHKNNINIAYSNRCFELWFLLHFQPVNSPVNKSELIKKIKASFKKSVLGAYVVNKDIFVTILPLQKQAVKNANHTVPVYHKINWGENLSAKGNPSTSLHFLIEEINDKFNNSL